ncbi:unnamed protein product [Xyrichtys novacula]|uniref:Unnamed protein product n=1 Tax=Xyrichtys novacula TaxID=13765 RepID=A0AAV1GPB2_XYRNO|nr:unnamed protein product [Xyrichtys novacula]
MPPGPASHQRCQIKSVTMRWKLLNNPEPSVSGTKTRPQHSLAQNATIHHEGGKLELRPSLSWTQKRDLAAPGQNQLTALTQKVRGGSSCQTLPAELLCQKTGLLNNRALCRLPN